jgi:hypothetical protein
MSLRGNIWINFNVPSKTQQIGDRLFVNILKDAKPIARHTVKVMEKKLNRKFLIKLNKTQSSDNNNNNNNNNNSTSQNSKEYFSLNNPILISARVQYNNFDLSSMKNSSSNNNFDNDNNENNYNLVGGKLKWVVKAFPIEYTPKSDNYLHRLDEYSFIEEPLINTHLTSNNTISKSDNSIHSLTSSVLSNKKNKKRLPLESFKYDTTLDTHGHSAIMLALSSDIHQSVGMKMNLIKIFLGLIFQ